MIHNLKPYPVYKDGGVAPLGNVPEHWQVRRIKRIAVTNPSKSEATKALSSDIPATFLPMERVSADGRIDSRESRPASALWTGFTYFRRADVIVAKITPCFENGKGACLDQLPTSIGFGSTEFHVLRASPQVLPRYLYRLTTLPEFRKLGADAMTGAAGQQRVPQSFVENFPVGLPPVSEQRVIVRFLEHLDRQIRRYIRAKQRVISLLNEQEQTVIQRAVTRGINSNARLKISGIDSVGEVPEHWEVLRCGRLFKEVVDTGHPAAQLLSIDRFRGIIPQADTGRKTRASEDRTPYKRVRPGDLAYNLMNAFMGSIGVSELDGILSPAYAVARPLRNVCTSYFHQLLRTRLYTSEFNRYSYGIMYERNRLYFDRFKTILVPVPPIQEQELIVAYMHRETNFIDGSIAKIRSEIELLREYRMRVIADVVTGKLDVREVAAYLPEEAEEPEPLGELDTLTDRDEDEVAELDAAPEETVDG